MALPTILSGNVTSALPTGFDVTNSVRFEQADDPYFQKTPTGDGNQRTFTFSVWLKMDLHDSGDTHKIFDTGTGTNYFTFYITEEPKLVVKGRISGSTVFELIPTQVFRDPTAWFHLYIAVDTTQGTASNRGKIYINGSQVTDFGTATYPSQNTDFEIQNASYPFRLGADKNLGDEHYDGYMAEYVFVDGAAQAISDFGEFDEDSPTIWKPKDVSAIDVNPSHANGNGFYLNFQNSSNLGVDSSGNTNFSVNNLDATDQATDTCTNNFATLNPLITAPDANTYKEGNCQVATHSDNYYGGHSTLGVSKGKWYFEAKMTSGANISFSGISADPSREAVLDKHIGNDADAFSYGMYGSNGNIFNNNSDSSYGNSVADNDIIGVYLDLDNNKLYFAENGSVHNSGTGISITAAASTSTRFYHFGVGDGSSGSTTAQCNFGGCPAFSISSGNSDPNGYGNFEYSTTITGDGASKSFYALCTKNLAEFG